jgi:hypothetical protein
MAGSASSPPDNPWQRATSRHPDQRGFDDGRYWPESPRTRALWTDWPDVDANATLCGLQQWAGWGALQGYDPGKRHERELLEVVLRELERGCAHLRSTLARTKVREGA